MNPDPNAPKNLAKLFGDMKDYVRQHRNGNTPIQKRAKAVSNARQVCEVCMKLFDFALIHGDHEIAVSHCEDCKKLLAQGYTALLESSRFAFVKMPEKDKDLRGLILRVDKATLDAVQKQMKENEQSKPT